jgi:hypothetical protein
MFRSWAITEKETTLAIFATMLQYILWVYDSYYNSQVETIIDNL